MQDQSTACACGCGTVIRPNKSFAHGHNRRVDPATRFWVKVDKDGPIPSHAPDLGACWIWTGARYPDGRGAFNFQGRTRPASAVAYILTHGDLPPDSPEATHLCDGGFIGCVRPSHLKADTHAGNFAGAAERARMPRGEEHHAAKLTTEIVREIRTRHSAGVSQAAMAREYELSSATISMVISGKRWGHV